MAHCSCPRPVALQGDVAQAGNDSLGIVDTASQTLIDSIWIGDEPASVIVDDETSTAYVSLEIEHAIAVVDLETHEVTDRLESPPGPRALGLTEDGQTLIVAGHRTGQAARYPYAEDEETQTDIAAIDVNSKETIWTIEEAGNIITDIWVDDAAHKVWIISTVAFPERGLVTLESPPFESQVQEYDLSTGEWLRTTVLGPAQPDEGYVLGPQALTVHDGIVWVVAQDSELLVGLDSETMSERARISIPGGPRAVLPTENSIWIHANQTFELHKITDESVEMTIPIGDDPRPASMIAGHGHYIQPGESYAQNFSCNSCHYDGRGDTQVWRAGPFETWELSRPMMWLEGTAPLGWGAYVNDTRTFGYTGFTSIIAKWPSTEMAEDLSSFLSSLVPPPKANAWTQRDGQLSDAAQVGKALYEGKAGCAACHGGALTTSNQTIEEGITGERASTPILVGSYRHNAWLMDGSARSLRSAIVTAAEWSGVTDLTDDEVDALERYLSELTDRDFFLLSRTPSAQSEQISAQETVTLTFNQPIWTGEENIQRIHLMDDDGNAVDFDLDVQGRTATLTPTNPLSPASTYTASVDAGFEAFDERKTGTDIRFSFETADLPSVKFEGDYELTIQMPAFDFEADGLSPDVTVTVANYFSATPSTTGSDIVVDLSEGLTWDSKAVINGTTFEIPPLPIKAGNSLAQGSALRGEVEDADDDGVVDFAEGTLIFSGPGFYAEDVAWEITPKTTTGGCVPGAEGAMDVTVDIDGDAIIIDWGEAEALGLYVTSYGATLPMGPGTVISDGDAFWAISTTAFPQGFIGPVVYAEVPEYAIDESETHGAPIGGAELQAGECYQFSVITTAFQTGSFTIEL